MKTKTFRYTNFAPSAATDVNGNRMKNTNEVNLLEENGKISYSRCYVSKDGSISSPIVHNFSGKPSVNKIVRQIHWGCCGWDANPSQLTFLKSEVENFLDS